MSSRNIARRCGRGPTWKCVTPGLPLNRPATKQSLINRANSRGAGSVDRSSEILTSPAAMISATRRMSSRRVPVNVEGGNVVATRIAICRDALLVEALGPCDERGHRHGGRIGAQRADHCGDARGNDLAQENR